MNDESVQAAADLATFSREDWVNFFSERVTARKMLIAGYMAFIDRLCPQGLPPIFEERHLAELLGLRPKELSILTLAPNVGYRSFSVPKRSGDTRLISVPVPSLAHSQRWIDFNVLRRLEVSDFCHGYMAKKSNLSNASIHIGSAAVLHLDIRNFFPSITIKMVVNLFQIIGYPPRISEILAKLCTHKGSLPQGAPSSPQISNVIFKPLDDLFGDLACEHRLSYSRYVDDLIFSGDEDDVRRGKIGIEPILNSFGFELNPFKTFMQIGQKKIVTGISIGSGVPKIPRSLRRAYAHSIFTSIKQLEAGDLVDRNPLFIESELGKLAYWLNVDPGNRQAISLRRRLLEAVKLPQS